MNNEIKEILENIKKCCDIMKDNNFVVYQKQDILKLLDYITNLQQENERQSNTIIELEEYINNNKKLLAETLNDGTFTIFNYINADELLDKLRELKGDSSNE